MNSEQIKIVVVEDESPLLKHIHKKIEAVSSDFTVIGAAYNGKEALEIISATPPDIVFTDIKMPIMDGLELSRILYEQFPDIRTVVVSGYDDFEYARTVLSYRVCDYLLKPLQPDILKKVLLSLQTSILEEKRTKIYDLLDCQLKGEQLPAHWEDLRSFINAASFSLFMICHNNLQIHSQHNDISASVDLFHFPWESVFEHAPFALSGHWLFPGATPNTYLTVIQNLSVSEDTAAHFLLTALQDHLTAERFTLVYDHNQVDFSQLYHLKQRLHNRLYSSYVIGHPALINTAEKSTVLPPAVLSKDTSAYFRTMLSANNTSGFASALSNLFADWEMNKLPQQWIDKVLTQLLYLLHQHLFFSNEEYEEMCSNVFHILETQPCLLSAGEKIIAELLGWVTLTSTIPTAIENTIEELDTFIRLHYREELSLADLAERYHFNHSYLTRAFRKQKGEAPLKLINSLKIKDAKELLLNPQLSIKEISEMLGFSSQHYFSRCFKNFTGISPNEYRNSPN